MSRLTDLRLSTIVKLGTIMVYAEKIVNGIHTLEDDGVLRSLLSDPEIVAWRKIMDNAGLLPGGWTDIDPNKHLCGEQG
jgi:hypothetical protein